MVRSAPDESEFKPGQRVSAFTMLGGWAERVAVPPASMVPTPDDIDDAAAVALLGNYYTMYFALAAPRRAAARRDGAGARLGRRDRHGRDADRKGAGRQGDRDGAPAAGDRLRRVARRRRGVAADRRLAAGGAERHRRPRRGHGGRPDRRRGVRRRDPGAGHRGPAAGRRLRGRWRFRRSRSTGCCCATSRSIGVGLGRVRQPQARVPSRCSASGWRKLVKAGLRPPPPVRYPAVGGAGRRCRAWPTAACSARSCWSRERPRALAFDVFGTVVDWRSSIIRELEKFGRQPWAATGLADFRRQLARRICPGDGPGAPRRTAVDENRRPAPA